MISLAVLARGVVMDTIVDKGLLYDFYGALLTERQREIYEDTVYHDMSLAEIAENRGISRQGVADLLKRSTRTLAEYEETLGMVKRFRTIDALCEEMEVLCRTKEDAAGDAGNAKQRKQLLKCIARIRKAL